MARPDRLLPLLSPAATLALWEALVRLGVLDQRFVPPPTAIAATLLHLLASGELAEALRVSLWRILAGFAAGALPGMVLGLTMGVARSFGARRRDYYLTVALPGALPAIFTGLKLGMGTALLLIVDAEMVGAKSGLGYLIWTGYEAFDPERMFAGLVVMALLGYASAASLEALERLAIPWRPRR